MQPIAFAPTVKRLLQELKISPNKLLGQNFLICESLAEKIVHTADIMEGDSVLEIGPGLGALSEHLSERADCLTLIELDERLYKHLLRLFNDNPQIDVINADALSFNYAAYAASRAWQEYQVVANLPYHITTPLIRYLLLHSGPLKTLTLMMQLEVAQKLLLTSDGETSGPLALLLQYFGTANLVFTVEKENFFPAPQVESAVVRVTRHPQPPFAVADLEQFASFLDKGFRHRRKTLINSLNNSLGGGVELWRKALYTCEVEENSRAEQVTLPKYVALFSLPQIQEYLGKTHKHPT